MKSIKEDTQMKNGRYVLSIMSISILKEGIQQLHTIRQKVVRG